MNEPPSSQQYKPGDLLPIGQLNWDDTMDDDSDDVKWGDPQASCSRRSHPSDGNVIDDGNGQEDMLGSENGTSKGKGTTDNKR
jgi:hypothetical protein